MTTDLVIEIVDCELGNSTYYHFNFIILLVVTPGSEVERRTGNEAKIEIVVAKQKMRS